MPWVSMKIFASNVYVKIVTITDIFLSSRARFKRQLGEKEAAKAIVEVVESSCLNIRYNKAESFVSEELVHRSIIISHSLSLTHSFLYTKLIISSYLWMYCAGFHRGQATKRKWLSTAQHHTIPPRVVYASEVM